MPPDRQRTVRELILGKTLKYGLFDEHDNFTDVTKLSDPSEARFYIHLHKGDYKTWKTYGVWLGEIPDRVFDDGKTFYYYLRQWLFDGYTDKSGNVMGFRDMLNRNNLKTVFFTMRDFIEHTDSSISKVIKQMFFAEYGTPTTPHTLRHIYDTHIRDIGLDYETLKSIAYWMKHDEKEAQFRYTHLTNSQKLRCAKQVMRNKDLH